MVEITYAARLMTIAAHSSCSARLAVRQIHTTRAKPAAAKGRYILSITATTTMGPGIRIDSGRTRRGEIMLGAGASPSDEDAKEGEAGPSDDQPAEEPATA